MASSAIALERIPSPAGACPADTGEPRLQVLSWADCGESDLHEWMGLARRAVEPNPFFEPWYLLPSLKALDACGQAKLLVLKQAGRWIGMMPVAARSRYYGRPIPHSASWVHANCFLGSPLVASGHEGAFWHALLVWADACAKGLFLHLPQMALDGPLLTALRDCVRAEGRGAGIVMREERALLRSTLCPDAYLELSMSGKKRKELRRQHNRLCEQGSVEFTRDDSGKDIDVWTEAFLHLEKAGWKGANGSALACSPQTQALFREALAGAAAAGRLERLTLCLDGRPIAMLANFLTAPGAFSYKTAFDEAYARFSPGVLLQRENLALLERPEIDWCDSCAAPDHPMIDHVWRERRAVGSLSIAIGGALRRTAFRLLLNAELGRRPDGARL